MTTDDESKFTPGPWHCGDFYDDYAVRGAKCNRVIARPNCNFEDAKANAALIAAAPEMYARLEQVAEDFEALGLTSNRDSVLRLLAKARGENTDATDT
jgi:hypothetical protein